MRHLTYTLTTFSVLTAASFVVGAGQVQATSLTPISETTCSTDNFTGTDDCEGIFSGNTSNTIDENTTVFGLKGWKEILKVDSDVGSTTNDYGTLTMEGTAFDDDEAVEGTWALTDFNFALYEAVMFGLKGGPTFTMYLSDGETTSGTWNTNDLQKNNGSSNPALSNTTVWVVEKENGDPEPVPEPATILGLAAVSLAARSLRRKSEEG